ncbi:MAG TPA: Asp-tRNA(Asn)/Glu-tRNA(Gln) amidotransferase GatCAB subunit B, partial [Gammaproteobacteria bacterium]
AIEVEARRQIGILEDGGSIEQETRLFDPERGETRSMRSKEEAHDYRYFPDPDLMPLRLAEERIERLRASLPELPDARKAHYMREHGLSADVAGVLVADADRAAYFDAVVGEGIDPRAANNWIVGEIIGLQNREGVELDAVAAKVPPERLARLIRLQVEGTISARSAKDVLQVMYAAGGEPEEIVAERGLRQVSDTGAIAAAVEAVLAANTDKVADYRAGKDKLLGFFVGQVMKATAGKADPKAVNRLLRDKLAG